MGFRVPFFAVSPWSRGGHVVSEVFDHTSVIQVGGAGGGRWGGDGGCAPDDAQGKRVSWCAPASNPYC